MDLSVIIVNYNTKKLLENCLKSIFKFSKNVNFEVIMVDNGSKDNSQQMVKTKFPQVKLIPNRDNLGFAKANNQGIRVAKGKYVLLLNSDTYLVENSFKKIVENANQLENLGVIGPLLLNEDKSIQQSVGFFPHLPQIFFWMTFMDDLPGGTTLKPYHIDHESFYKQSFSSNKNHKEVDWVTGAAFLVPKKVINGIGPLDDEIFMYGEDVEWCYRIKKAGYNVYFSPETKIVHIGGGSMKKNRTRAYVGEFRGIKYFYSKHKGKFSLQIARLLLKMGALLRILIFGVLGRGELAKSYVEAFKMA